MNFRHSVYSETSLKGSFCGHGTYAMNGYFLLPQIFARQSGLYKRVHTRGTCKGHICNSIHLDLRVSIAAVSWRCSVGGDFHYLIGSMLRKDRADSPLSVFGPYYEYLFRTNIKFLAKLYCKILCAKVFRNK